MKDSHDIFKESNLEMVKNTFAGNKKDSGDDTTLFALLTIVLFIGSEAVRVVFRRNFGRDNLNIGMIIWAFAAFAGISIYTFYYYYNYSDEQTSQGTKDSFFITGFIFLSLAILILVKGIRHINHAVKSNDYSKYYGESSLLRSLKGDKWTDDQIRLIADPLLVFIIGFTYFFFNEIGGVALMICGASIWGREIVEVVVLGNPVTKKLNEQSVDFSRKTNNRVNR